MNSHSKNHKTLKETKHKQEARNNYQQIRLMKTSNTGVIRQHVKEIGFVHAKT